MTQEGAAVACAKRGDALCFDRFMIEQIPVPALKICAKMLREGSAVRHTSEQTDASKYEGAYRGGTNEEGR